MLTFEELSYGNSSRWKRVFYVTVVLVVRIFFLFGQQSGGFIEIDRSFDAISFSSFVDVSHYLELFNSLFALSLDYLANNNFLLE